MPQSRGAKPRTVIDLRGGPRAAIPTVHAGVLMRSRLEARWAGVLDRERIGWAYEPKTLRLGSTRYIPDFWLPGQRTWLEVKGPHWERFEKTQALARAGGQVLVATASGVCWRVPRSGKPSQVEVQVGRCGTCGTTALGVPSRGTLACRAPGCGARGVRPEAVLGW